MNNVELHRYALVGAEARLLAIAAEADAVYRIFPDLRVRPVAVQAVPATHKVQRQARAEAPADSGGGAGKRGMNAAQRKAVGERMKKYWAARRSQSQQASKNAQPEATVAAEAPASNGSRTNGATRAPRTMSAAARKRISDAQRARWAKQRGAKATKTTKTTRRARARA